MKRYSVAQVRERLADALDQADAGIPVIIERRGVRYRVSVETTRPARKKTMSRLEILDPAVEAGDWTWDMPADGLAFVPGSGTR